MDKLNFRLRLISISMIMQNCIYFLVMLWAKYNVFHVNMPSFSLSGGLRIFIVVFSLGVIAVIFPIKDIIWKSHKGRINSPESFYSAILSVCLATVSIADAIGMLGLVLFFLTRDWNLSLLLLIISLAGKIIFYPWQLEIIEKKKEFNFFLG